MRLPLAAFFGLVLALCACGYRSLVSTTSSVDVAVVTTQTPRADLAACLTSELRTGFSAHTRWQSATPRFRLEATLLETTLTPETLARDRAGLRSVEVEVGLVVRVRLIDEAEGEVVAWGPVSYRLDTLGVSGPTALSHLAVSRQGGERLCREIAQRIVEETTIFLVTDHTHDR